MTRQHKQTIIGIILILATSTLAANSEKTQIINEVKYYYKPSF